MPCTMDCLRLAELEDEEVMKQCSTMWKKFQGSLICTGPSFQFRAHELSHSTSTSKCTQQGVSVTRPVSLALFLHLFFERLVCQLQSEGPFHYNCENQTSICSCRLRRLSTPACSSSPLPHPSCHNLACHAPSLRPRQASGSP